MGQDSLADRYLTLLDEIVQATLKGKIQSKTQVEQWLLDGVEAGTGEIFERCLSQRLETTQTQIQAQSDELKLAKAHRSLRALQTIQGEWERLRTRHQQDQTVATALEHILECATQQRLQTVIRWLDPNLPESLNPAQLRQLAKNLDQSAELQPLARGLRLGLDYWQHLEGHVVGWVYDDSQRPVGFTEETHGPNPWKYWSEQLPHGWLQGLLQQLGQLGSGRDTSLDEWLTQQGKPDPEDWIAVTLALSYLQRALVSWADRQIYNAKIGSRLSITIYLGYAILWAQLGNLWQLQTLLNPVERDALADSCLQVSFQILRTFTQQSYFPLYGGVFATFGGRHLRGAMEYLDAPMKQVEGTQAKARVLTLLGYSQRARGNYQQAEVFHQEALKLAQQERDQPCETANLNHLSRLWLGQKRFAAAISNSQRALVLSRQTGDRVGEANALANLGFSEVFAAQETHAEPEVYELAVEQLQRGLQLSESLQDQQSQALCRSSLGVAYLILEQPRDAIYQFAHGWKAAQISGDIYLQGINMANLAQAFHQSQQWEQVVFAGCMGMYLLEQIGAAEWRSAAGLMVITQGQIGLDAFRAQLDKDRSQFLEFIGVDGFDHIPQLLSQYQQSLES